MRASWVIVGLGLVLAACGGTVEPDRFDLRTPGVHTGAPVPQATAAPRATAAPPASARKGKVTVGDRRVIKGWSDTLRHGHVSAAARYFTVPARVSAASSTGWQYLRSKRQIEAFNRGLSCGAKLIRTRPGVDRFVVGIFKLTERKGAGAACGAGVGETVAVAFLIRGNRIQQWVQADPDAVDPPATTSPTPSPEPTTSGLPTES